MKEFNEEIERDLDELQGSKRIRIRPSVVLGSDGIRGVQQTLFEIITNSIDRWKDGYGDKVIVTRHKDNSYTIQDFADGLPVKWNEKRKCYNWDLALCTLYGGDNYDQPTELTGKLGNFGLGLTSTQYSSEWMKVVVRKKNVKYTLNFREGRVVNKDTFEFIKEDNDIHCTKEESELALLEEENNDNYTGTTIIYKPDLNVFSDINIDTEWIQSKLQKQAMINNGITIEFNDELNDLNMTYHYDSPKDYMKDIIREGYFCDFIEIYGESEGRDAKHRDLYKMNYDVSISFNNDNSIQQYYHNSSELTELNVNVTTKALEKAITESIHKYIEKNSLYKKNERIKFNDISDSLVFILRSKSTQTSYANQTKLSINNSFIKDFITKDLEDKFTVFLTENTIQAKHIIDKVLINMRANNQALKSKLNIKKELEKNIRSPLDRPSKFTPCRSKNPKECRFIMTEGDSSIEPLRKSRDKLTTALYALKGKPINALKAELKDLLNNQEVKDIFKILQCGMMYKGKPIKDIKPYTEEDLLYDKICICADMDCVKRS